MAAGSKAPYDEPCDEPRRDGASRAVDRLGPWAVALLAGLLSIWASSKLDPANYAFYDFFFQADTPRIVANLTDPQALENGRNTVHPIFSLLGYGLFSAVAAVGAGKVLALRICIAIFAAATAAFMFLAMRRIGLGLGAALLYCSVFLASATFIHWFAIPEVYSAGAMTICAMLWIAARRRPPGAATWVIGSAATLSMTITNWSVALLASIVRLPFWTAVKISAAALAVVVVAALVQRAYFPHSGLFFNVTELAGESAYAERPNVVNETARWRIRNKFRAAVLSSAVAPPPEFRREPEESKLGVFVENQFTTVSQTSLPGLVALAAWILMILGGLWGAATKPALRPIATVLIGFTVFQIAMHLFYGTITFLYAAHYFPPMVLLAALGHFTPGRKVFATCAVLFVVFGGFSNYREFGRAADMVNSLTADAVAGKIAVP